MRTRVSAGLDAWVQPVVLQQGSIRLEPLAPEHEAGLAEAAADGALWNLQVTRVPPPDQTADWIAEALALRAAAHRMPFIVRDVARDRILGSTSYHDILPAVRRLEIGYTWLARSVQRSVVNTTCKLLLLDHAFGVLGAGVVGWRTDHLNTVSQQAIERLGARRDGVLRHHALRHDGTVRDTVFYSMLPGEWPACRARLVARLERGA